MANTEQYNVIFVDTTGYTRSTNTIIKQIRYVGNTAGTAVITAGTSGSGSNIYEASGTANDTSEVMINAPQGIHVAVTNGAKVYIYLK